MEDVLVRVALDGEDCLDAVDRSLLRRQLPERLHPCGQPARDDLALLDDPEGADPAVMSRRGSASVACSVAGAVACTMAPAVAAIMAAIVATTVTAVAAVAVPLLLAVMAIAVAAVVTTVASVLTVLSMAFER